MESDIEHLLPEGTPVRVRADNAYYSKSFAKFCKKGNRDYSISVTHPKCKAPVLEMIEGLPDEGWEDIGLCEQATLVLYKAGGWEEHSHIVIRKFWRTGRANSSRPTPSSWSPETTCPSRRWSSAIARSRGGLRPLIRYFIRTVARLVRASGRWRLDFKIQLSHRLDMPRRHPIGVTAASPPPLASEIRSKRLPGGMPSASAEKNMPKIAEKY